MIYGIDKSTNPPTVVSTKTAGFRKWWVQAGPQRTLYAMPKRWKRPPWVDSEVLASAIERDGEKIPENPDRDAQLAAIPDEEPMKITKYEDVDFEADPWRDFLWGVEGQEVLDRDIDHLIEELIDDVGNTSGTLTIKAWLRHEIDEDDIKRLANRALHSLWDELDEEYGNQDAFEDRQQPDAEDEAATREWVKAILSSFEVWTCDEADQQVVVDVRKWAEKHAPHWLKDDNQTTNIPDRVLQSAAALAAGLPGDWFGPPSSGKGSK